ncbi:MAG: class I SAM-dependent methyltransferase [Planctomycetes bacterium]|nr:class I SAM-dependent methyltransferase [Planctomycetota bacterium]
MSFPPRFGTLQISPRALKPHVDRALAGLRLPPAPRVLDAGCGHGLWSAYLVRRLPRASFLGVDIDAACVSACAALGLGSRARFEVLDLHRLEKRGAFDLILCMNSIHYRGMEEVEILGRLARALAPAGRLLFVGPMATDLQPFPWERFRPRPDYDGYTVEGLREKARRAGLVEILARPVVGPLGTLAKGISRAVQGAPILKFLVYPFLYALLLLDALLPAQDRAYYLLGIFAPGGESR